MAKSPKKIRVIGSAKAAGEATSKPKKKSMATATKKAHQKGTLKATAVAKTPTKPSPTKPSPTKPSPKAVAGTPTKKGKKLETAQTTPTTVSLKSTTDSKRAVTLMSGLALKSPSAQKKSKAEDEDEASLSDTVDYQDPNTILWLKAEGVADALEYHFPDHEEYLELDYHEQILLLVKVFKPAEMRSVLQGLLTDAGKNWRKLKLQKKLRSMSVLAPEFAKVCVELFNAKTELEMSKSVPEDIVIDHDKSQKKITS